MIVPILKYHFIVFHRDYSQFLEGLRDIGEFHIKEINPASDEIRAKQKDIQQLHNILEHYHESLDQNIITGRELPKIVTQEWRRTIEELGQVKKELGSLNQEKYLLENTLGEFSTERFNLLAKSGIHAHLFSCKNGHFDEKWTTQHGAEVINLGGRKTYFITFSDTEKHPEIESQIETIPSRGTQELEQLIAQKQVRINDIEKQLELNWDKRKVDLMFTINLVSDQNQLLQAGNQSNKSAEEKLHHLQAWVTKEKVKEVDSFLEKAEIYFETEAPNPEEKNPILLKNNSYSKLFEPIGSLFSLPSYSELDLTSLFAPFFTLFFGFCLGDAGYGLLILLGITIFGKKLGDENKGIIRLAQILGAATIVFGVITGTLFGINLGAEESALLPSKVKELFLGPDQLFNLSLALGGVQILFGMVIKMVNQYRQFGFVYTLSTFGWISLVTGLAFLGLEIHSLTGSILSWAGVGFILLFNDPKANVFARLGKGLWELYGITGVFGDLLSYIRLFALGLSSSILGFVINDIGLGFLDINPVLGPILFIIFMIIGHGLNLFIAGLGAFVHPMRLTFVEFYKNAGFTGGGVPFKPFKKEIT